MDRRRIKTLAEYLKQELNKVPKLRVHTPTDSYLSGGLTAFSIEGVDLEKIVDFLRVKYNIVVRTIGRDRDKTSGIRVSTHVFVSTKQVDLVLGGVNHIAQNWT
jgi:selenocysteine lyase/cysteine desulfurase